MEIPCHSVTPFMEKRIADATAVGSSLKFTDAHAQAAGAVLCAV